MREQRGGTALRRDAFACAYHGRADDQCSGLLLEALKGDMLTGLLVGVPPDLLALMQVHMFRLTGGICTPRRNKTPVTKFRRHLERRESPRLPPVSRVFLQVS